MKNGKGIALKVPPGSVLCGLAYRNCRGAKRTGTYPHGARLPARRSPAEYLKRKENDKFPIEPSLTHQLQKFARSQPGAITAQEAVFSGQDQEYAQTPGVGFQGIHRLPAYPFRQGTILGEEERPVGCSLPFKGNGANPDLGPCQRHPECAPFKKPSTNEKGPAQPAPGQKGFWPSVWFPLALPHREKTPPVQGGTHCALRPARPGVTHVRIEPYTFTAIGLSRAIVSSRIDPSWQGHTLSGTFHGYACRRPTLLAAPPSSWPPGGRRRVPGTGGHSRPPGGASPRHRPWARS